MRVLTSISTVVLAIIAALFTQLALSDVIINEIMYNPDSAQGNDDDYEWIELHNTGNSTVNVGGWKVRDDNPQNDPFVIPSNTFIGAGDYLAVCSNVGFIYFTYGISNAVGNFADRFGLGNDGDTVTLLNASNVVIDQVTYNDAYPWPFQTDGDGPSIERISPLGESNDPQKWAASVPASDHGTPGKKNSLFSDGAAARVVISEIHYHPASANDDYEYVELYNNSGSALNLVGWEFTNGISFKFLQPTPLAASEYLVVCKNQERIRSTYGIENVVGDFAEGSSLNNAGETIVLRDNTGRVVDFVAYSDERYWPIPADGHGPSIECINPNLPNSDPANWASSTLTRRWVFVETAPAKPTGDFLYFYLDGQGEVLLDDVALVREGTTANLVPNGHFEAGDAGWVKYGNHSSSTRTDTAAHSGTASMKVLSTGDGGGGEWRNYIGIPLTGLSESQNYILSFWAKPISGETRFTGRVANSYASAGICAITDLSEKGFVSTPGTQNAARLENLPPLIYHVIHAPNVPNSETSPWINARVVDDGPVSSVSLEYSTGGEWVSVPMADDGISNDGLAGDGEFGVRLPAQPSYTIVRFRITAEDGQGAVSVSPDPDDMKSTHAYFCYDNEITSRVPIYFLFVSDENLQRLEELGSRDDYVPGTLIYAGVVYDNVGVRWYGNFSERIATNKKNWRIRFDPWDDLDGVESLILLGGDYDDPSLRGGACIREALTQQVFRFAGCAYSQTKHVHLQLNGAYYGLMLSVERPDTDYLERNLRDVNGDLFQAQGYPGQPPSNMSVLPSYDEYLFAYDKKTNRAKPHDLLVSLIEGLRDASDEEINDFFEANLNVQLFASYVASAALAQDWVSPSRDYYLFYGKKGTTETYLWELMPWGGEHNWERPSLPVLNGIVGENEFYLPNVMRTRFLNDVELQGAFADRLRYLLDTTFTEPHLFSVIAQMQALIRTAADNDRDFWWPEADSLASHIAALKSNIVARRAFLYQWLDMTEGPAQPTNVSPANGAEYIAEPITLVASEFSGIPGSAHDASQWQVRSQEGLYSTPVWDSGEITENKTSVPVPPGTLAEDQTLFWHVRYMDDQARWSLWSNETSFFTNVDTTPPSILSATFGAEHPGDLVVVFSEPVEASSAETLSNYSLSGEDFPDVAALSADGLTVTLKIALGSPLFWLGVSNVTDRATSPNVIPADTRVTIELLFSPETKINFQPGDQPVPPGYLEDAGAPFDEGRGYGWTTDITDLALVRNLQSDLRLDTIIPFGGEGSAWEIALPSPARYRVTACVGDAAADSLYDLAVEGTWFAAGLYLPTNQFLALTQEIDVADGRLTLYGGSVYKRTRIAYVHVQPVYQDSDADSIDDVWEISYFGSVEDCDPDADTDSDGASNYAEYIAKTNPVSSSFGVSKLAPSSSNTDWLEITWSYSPDKAYRIHWAESLLSWTAFTPQPVDVLVDEQAGTITWTDKGNSPGMGGVAPGQSPRRFYTVELLTP